MISRLIQTIMGLLISTGTIGSQQNLVSPVAEPIQVAATNEKSQEHEVAASNCSSRPPLELEPGEISELVALEWLQQQCGSLLTDTVMVFLSMPRTTKEAEVLAESTAVTLNQFAANGVTPWVMVEPTYGRERVALDEIARGEFDEPIQIFLKQLVSLVGEEAMGVWTIFPEPNVPKWVRTGDALVVSQAIDQFQTSARLAHPRLKVSVLLHSRSYAMADTQWSQPLGDSLGDYVSTIPRGNVDWVGLQGFPWIAVDGSAASLQADASDWLDSDKAIALAKELGSDKIWLNTGVFAEKYTNSPTPVLLTVDQRRQMLQSILGEAVKIREAGYEVVVNLFIENKAETGEATDWSFRGDASGEEWQVLVDFARELEQNGVKLAIYDAQEN